MSLRLKLPLFIVLLVFVASIAILSVSVYQTRKRGESDVATIRTNETAKVKNTIKEHVDIMYSLINAQYQRSFSLEEVVTIFNKTKAVTYDNGRGYFWVSDMSDTPHVLIHPYFDSLGAADKSKVLFFVRDINRQVANQGDGFVETAWPKLTGMSISDSAVSKLCYARVFAPLKLVIASGRSTDDIDGVIRKRSEQTQSEIASIIRDRIIFALLILVLSTLAVVFFTGMITSL